MMDNIRFLIQLFLSFDYTTKNPAKQNRVTVTLLKQDFKADRPNQKWVTDITYLPYGEKMLYLSTIMDLYNNEIIAYKVSDTQEVKLVLLHPLPKSLCLAIYYRG